jgi:hypothetical protein
MFVFQDNRFIRNHEEMKDDCAVRAIATALQIPYPTALNIARTFMNYPMTRTGGANGYYLMDWLDKHPSCQRVLDPFCGITQGQFILENPVGAFLIMNYSHIFCLIDGIIYDINWNLLYGEETEASQRIYAAWEVRPSGIFLTM